MVPLFPEKRRLYHLPSTVYGIERSEEQFHNPTRTIIAISIAHQEKAINLFIVPIKYDVIQYNTQTKLPSFYRHDKRLQGNVCNIRKRIFLSFAKVNRFF